MTCRCFSSDGELMMCGECSSNKLERKDGATAERARIVAAIRKRAMRIAPDKYYTADVQREVADWIERGCPDGE